MSYPIFIALILLKIRKLNYFLAKCCFYKLIVKSYQLSSTIIYTIISCCILYLITRGTSYRKGWSYISFNEGKLKYIDFVGILLVIATLITLLTEIIRIYRKKSYNKANVFVSDDPIISNNQDKLEYEKRVSYTLSYIDKAYFEKSFTVGIVGPWGNGKSSFIALVEEKLKKEPLQLRKLLL